MTIRGGAAMLLACLMAMCAGCVQRQSSSQYQHELSTSDRHVVKVQRELDSRSVRDVAWLERQQRIVRSHADRMESIQPPRDARQAHRTYVRGISDLSGVLAQFADCGRAEQQHAGDGARCRAKLSARELERIDNDLAESRVIFANAGYRVQDV